ncbi:MAG: PHP domain-containing protein [Patescibacteria group bacterium]
MKVDLHTHTVASGHAFGTIWENSRQAKLNGLEMIAIADHGPAGAGAPDITYFRVGIRNPKIIEGVRVLFGVEANVIDDNGSLDLPNKVLEKLDIVMVGLHRDCGYVDQGLEKNTEVLIKAMKNPYVKMVSHPYGSKIKVDIEKITKAAIEENVLLELNASYFVEDKLEDEEMWTKIKTMVKILKDNHKKIIINSDAHTPYEIGDFTNVINKFDELGINEDDILNNDPAAILKFFNISD